LDLHAAEVAEVGGEQIPGATAGGTTHVPVVTNWPAEMPPA
jgi:hypothetical protein